MSKKFLFHKFLWVFIPLAITALLLWPGLKGPLIYDDYNNLSPLMTAEADYKTVIFDNNAGPLGRGFTMATFAANHWIKGGLVLFDLKLTNLFIHLLNGLLVYCLIYFLLKIKLSTDKAVIYAALVMAFWLLNPVNTGVVFYVIQRAALLAMTFMLIASLAYVRMRVSCNKISVHSLGLMVLCLSSWVIAMVSKENAVLLPLIILCIELCFFDAINVNRLNKKSGMFLFILGVSFLLVSIVFLDKFGFLNYSTRWFSLEERLYTQPVALLIYLKEILIPQTVDVSLWNDDFTIRKTFWNSATIFSLVFIGSLILISIFNLRNVRYKYISAGILIYFSGHLIESSIFPLQLFFLHRNYFPSIGLYLSLILMIDKGVVTNLSRKFLFAISIMYFSLLGQQSYAQAKIWSSYESILMNAYKKHPESIGVNLEIVGKLVHQKDLPLSLSINNAIISARPVDSLPAKIQRFYIYCELANDMPNYEYKIFDENLNLNRRLLISSALDNFVQSYINNQCDFINLRRVIDSFTSWSDKQLSLGTQSTWALWHIDYYIIELLLLLDEKEEALSRLDLHIDHGNGKAILTRKAIIKGDKIF